MSTVTFFVTKFVLAVLGCAQFLMFVRAVISWLPINEDSPICSLVYYVTEMFIFPVRALLERSEQIQMLPIDLSFFVTFILLSVLETVIGAL